MTKTELKLIVRRVMEDFDLDDRVVAVEDFLSDLVTTLEYETDIDWEDDDDEEDSETEE